jgi:hypothetical protein
MEFLETTDRKIRHSGAPYRVRRATPAAGDMGANRSAVDVVMRALGHRLGESGGHTLPDTVGAPARAVPSDKTDKLPPAK